MFYFGGLIGSFFFLFSLLVHFSHNEDIEALLGALMFLPHTKEASGHSIVFSYREKDLHIFSKATWQIECRLNVFSFSLCAAIISS